jgi:hypothetical protein
MMRFSWFVTSWDFVSVIGDCLSSNGPVAVKNVLQKILKVLDSWYL